MLTSPIFNTTSTAATPSHNNRTGGIRRNVHVSESRISRSASAAGPSYSSDCQLVPPRTSSRPFPSAQVGREDSVQGSSPSAAHMTETMTRTRAATTPQNAIPPPPPPPTGGLIGQIPDNSGWQPSMSPTTSAQPNIDLSSLDSALAGSAAARSGLPMIKFIPHRERNGRPSLEFQVVSRTLPREEAIIRVGRYSERENQPEPNSTTPSEAPIGFKSKVVSRRHCEFSYTNGQWYIKDVKSSSGTFLNHIRLSQPGVESRLFPVTDGDIVQLGIDFKGGEEMIYRCVKIRIECNRGWQKSINKFNKSTHKRLRELSRTAKAVDGEEGSKFTTECTICLNSIAPCQALFVAPCSHTWHYKCIKPMLDELDPLNQQLLCPNCRARADLDADVDIPLDFEDWSDEEDLLQNDEDEAAPNQPNGQSTSANASDVISNGQVEPPEEDLNISDRDREADQLAWALSTLGVDEIQVHRSRHGSTSSNLNPSASTFVPGPSSPGPRFPVRAGATNDSPFYDRTLVGNISEALHGTGEIPMDIADESSSGSGVNIEHTSQGLVPGARPIPPVSTTLAPRTLTPPHRDHTTDGPMTPRNTAGPFVFDGGAGKDRAS